VIRKQGKFLGRLEIEAYETVTCALPVSRHKLIL
jgi:hypothetical protein